MKERGWDDARRSRGQIVMVAPNRLPDAPRLDREWLTLTEAAAELGVTAQRIRQSKHDAWWYEKANVLGSRLRMYKPGRDWLVSRSSLDAEIARRRAEEGRP